MLNSFQNEDVAMTAISRSFSRLWILGFLLAVVAGGVLLATNTVWGQEDSEPIKYA